MMNMSLHVCTHTWLVSSPSTIVKQNFAYIKITMDCILPDMKIFWEMKAARVPK